MRLWHERMLPFLSDQRILGQHRECCGMRGKFWGKNHSTVDYVWDYAPIRLSAFHCLVLLEGIQRGFDMDCKWFNSYYRGENNPWGYFSLLSVGGNWRKGEVDGFDDAPPIYPEHDEDYLRKCLNNLEEKGVDTSEMRTELL